MSTSATLDARQVTVSSETFVRSLERGLAVIKAFDADHPRLTLSDVARRTGLTRAAARRFLLTLVELGYVHAADGVFSLRPRVLELGWAYLSGLPLLDVTRPHMERLSTEVHESVSVSVLDGDDLVYVGRVQARKIMRVAIDVGTRLPAYCTSMGRVLLAHLPPAELTDYLRRVRLDALTEHTVTDADLLADALAQVRADGYAVVDQELELGLRSMAAPLHGRGGEVVAALNVAAPLERGSLDEIRDELLPPLLAAARACEADLLAH
ncbi:IclR family transcriptional regulator domain-containing protein [Aquipuribacter sp. SD81]|uniref:IclR family transcriptional regulator domain-containing protein n=1 Tax=Aquipuribacter sp. SD81 TaxID=3127703 RepID=UPI003018B0D6